jgi:hypothetical protein
MKALCILATALVPASLATLGFGQTTFTNVIEETGINFVHQLDGTCPGPPVGSGSAWADYDNDGDIDLYITNHGGPSGLYRNEGDTNGDGLPDFTNVAPALGVDEVGLVSHGVVFADYDNDGDQDLYVTHWGGNTLYQNRLIETGTATFVDVTVFAGVGDGGRCITAAWGDYNQDGWIDLYLARHFDCLPSIRNSRDALLQNNGDGTFTNVSQYLCADHTLTCPQLNLSHAFSAAWFDFDNDGDPDIFIASDVIAAGWPNILWRNDGPDGSGGWTFTDVSIASGANYSINCKGLGVGDYDNDGYLDLAFGHAEGGFLLHNDGDGTFTDVSDDAGVRTIRTPLGDVAVTWGTVFFDYDNDGWLDLFQVRGMISGLTTPQPDVLYRNNQDGTFTDVSVETGVNDDRRGRSASICDLIRTALSICLLVITVYLWISGITRARSRGIQIIGFTINPEGTASNRDGIGARFYLTTPDGITQIREISSGPPHGGGDYKAAYFGMGSNTTGALSVRWPSGLVEDLETVNADQRLQAIEGQGVLSVHDPNLVATQYKLSQNYPNPFNPTTEISYSLPTGTNVTLKVYDALGREVANLVNGFSPAGVHKVALNASSFASGFISTDLPPGHSRHRGS